MKLALVRSAEGGGEVSAALLTALGFEAQHVDPGAGALPGGVQAVIVAGEVSATGRPVIAALHAFAAAGGPVLGIGGGFGFLCASELLPGTYAEAPVPDPTTHLRIEGMPTPFTAAICSDSKTSAALLKNIGQSQLTITENDADVLRTFSKNVLRLE